MRLSELIGSQVIDDSGERQGRVFDVVVEGAVDEPSGDHDVTVVWLVVGRRGFLERLGVPAWLSRTEAEPKPEGRDRVLWEDIAEAAPGRIVLHPKRRSS